MAGMRYLKTVRITFSEIDEIDNMVNATANKIKGHGGKIINIVPCSFGVSPMNLIYSIIYEREHEISALEFPEKKSKRKG